MKPPAAFDLEPEQEKIVEDLTLAHAITKDLFGGMLMHGRAYTDLVFEVYARVFCYKKDAERNAVVAEIKQSIPIAEKIFGSLATPEAILGVYDCVFDDDE
jgi:hypothetical protein